MAAVDEQKDAHYPCPACGQTLYGWTAAHDPLDRGKKIVLDRCENCGLAVTRRPEPPDAEAEIHQLISAADDGTVEIVAPNRRSFQGGLGGAQWAGLEPELRRLHLTPDSLGLLLRKQGLEVTDVGTPFRNRAFRLMWQTVVNAFTYRDNFVRNRRAGLIPEPGDGAGPLPLRPRLGRQHPRRDPGGDVRAAARVARDRLRARRRDDGDGKARSLSLSGRSRRPPMLSTMEGGFGMFGDPEDLQARLGELAESMQGAQKVAFADQAIQLAVTMTVAAIRQVELTGNSDEQATQVRDVIRMIFPEAVTLVSEARQGLS